MVVLHTHARLDYLNTEKGKRRSIKENKLVEELIKF